MSRISIVITLTLVSYWAGRATAQPVPSGPEKGSIVPALKVYDVTGRHKDNEVDYTEIRMDKPTIYVFIPGARWGRPAGAIIRTIDREISEKESAYQVAVWLTEETERFKAYLPRVHKAIDLESTALTYFPGEVIGPMGWKIDSEVDVTVIVAKGGKIVAANGFKTPQRGDARTVLKIIREVLKD